jgi:hypothetical protein
LQASDHRADRNFAPRLYQMLQHLAVVVRLDVDQPLGRLDGHERLAVPDALAGLFEPFSQRRALHVGAEGREAELDFHPPLPLPATTPRTAASIRAALGSAASSRCLA